MRGKRWAMFCAIGELLGATMGLGWMILILCWLCLRGYKLMIIWNWMWAK